MQQYRVPVLLSSIAILTLAIWLYLAFARGMFWRLHPFDDDLVQHQAPAAWPTVVAIVPARNEALTIAQSVRSLLQQNYPGEFSVIVVDDHSDDATAQFAQQAARELGVESRFTLLRAAPLETVWTGKLWALHCGTAISGCAPTASAPESATDARRTHANWESAAVSPTYYWFTDADILHAPDTLSRLVSRAERHHLDLTSLMVLLQAKTFPERLLIPPFLFFFLKLYPPRWIANPRHRTAGAAGGCILLRRDALDRIGGLTSIRNEVIDDCALARAVKSPVAQPLMAELRRPPSSHEHTSPPDHPPLPDQNASHPEAPRLSAVPKDPSWESQPASLTTHRLWLGLTRTGISLRAYNSFSEIRDMIARTAFTQLRYSALLLLGTLVGLLLTYIAPIALLFAHNPEHRILALWSWTLMSLLFLPTVRFYRLSALWAITLPVAAAFYVYATLLSAARYYVGRGAQWKGRSHAALPASSQK
jgi:hopene-associated glycosyltransferase HpnB